MSKLTKPGQTDVLFINVETGQVVRRIELEAVITNKAASKCLFLSCDGKRLYVVDLGKIFNRFLDSLIVLITILLSNCI